MFLLIHSPSSIQAKREDSCVREKQKNRSAQAKPSQAKPSNANQRKEK